MSTIDITDRLVLKQDDVFAFHDETGFRLQGDAAPELINQGRISLSMTLADASLALVASTADGAMVWNQAAGVMRFHAADSAGPEVFAIQSFGAASTLRNDGQALFEAERTVIATLDEGLGSRFINTGLWQVRAGERAGGGYFGLTEVHNSGDFIVESAHEAAFGIYFLGTGGSEGRLDNTGLIKVTGQLGAAAISLFDVFPDYRLTNSGRIVAQSSAFASIGITLPADGHALIETSGVIRADRAIWSAGGPGSHTIINSGKIAGAVLLGDGGDRVTNTGSIHGEVNLGDGYDRYDGSGGTLKGVLWGGGGFDTLIGGQGGEEIHGDEAISYSWDGGDLLKGGGGSDSLFGGGGSDTLKGGDEADFLHGEAGSDLLDGGHGGDVYVFAALAESAPGAADHIAHLQAGDWIDLSSIDADPDSPGDQAFAPDQVVLSLDKVSGETSITVDADRDGTADFLLIVEAGRVSFDQLVL